jgi:siroheme synthase (precorrin-2 oxidase/ferrochelatase)
VTTVVVGGTGEVAGRAIRQLLDSEGVDDVVVLSNDESRAERVAGVFGERVEGRGWSRGALPDCAVVVSARPSDEDLASAALDAGVPFVSVDDDQRMIFHLLGMNAAVADAGLTFAIGAGLVPGLGDLLARHALAEFDHVDEIRVARAGAAGPMSVATLKRELREAGVDRHAGEYRTRTGPTDELVWFPEPIESVECQLVVLGLRLLVDAFPDVDRISVLAGGVNGSDRLRFTRRRGGEEAEWGAARVEVWGSTGGTHRPVVYGLVDRTSVAAGTVLALTALRIAGIGYRRVDERGVHGLASLFEPVPFLADLAVRGVRGARFEGAPVA